MNENELLTVIKKIVGQPAGQVVTGIGDDAAVIKWTKTSYLLVTCDALVEGVHFISGELTWEQVGRKALAVNLSDIAAMAGLPLYATVSLGLPAPDKKLTTALYRGLSQLARTYQVAIIGGNLSHSARFFVDITVLGRVEKKRLVLRSGGTPGDKLFVTGTLGGSRHTHHFSFEPRIRLARRLTSLLPVKAMMDLSDGLGADLPRLAEASRTGFRLFADRVPISPRLLSSKTTRRSPLWHALNDGEDYELLFAVPEKYFTRVPHSVAGVPVTFIGELTDGEKVLIVSGKKITFPAAGFDHFCQASKK